MKKVFCITLLTLITSACSRYTVTFNDAPVYNPPTLFSDYTITDSPLDECVTLTIKDQKLTQASQLATLRCSEVGIASLDGLEKFTHIVVLDLSRNDLKNVSILHKLTHLTHINLSGNDRLVCKEASGLAEKVEQIILPAHCITKRL